MKVEPEGVEEIVSIGNPIRKCYYEEEQRMGQQLERMQSQRGDLT